MPSRKRFVQDRIVRRYKCYSQETLAKVVSEIKNGKISLNKAAVKYGISKGTLSHKINMKHSRSVGRSRVLSIPEEKSIVKHIIAVSEWGFPFTQIDLCQLTKLYLDNSNRHLPQFKNNMPSVQWARRFLREYKLNLTVKYCQNIKRSKAGLTAEAMQQYFDNLKETLTNEDGTIVSPENVFNYDETNLSDDPGVKKCIFKRGVKYPERICDTSKASTSLMFCGSATGKMLPPYVVYKGKHLYPTWMEGGPPDTRYNRSKSGWFDTKIFADWFATMFVPYIRKMKLTGKIVVLGDNLTSHFSEDVLSLCEKHNIAFVCLPTNSTHMTQPLDVAFYAPLKKSWRGILDNWKKGLQKKSQTITKERFPALLKKLNDHVTAGNTSSKNLVAGFKKCGIYPLNPSEVIDRLPKYNEADDNISENVSMAVMEMLKDLRNGLSSQTKTRRQKLDVEAGKSVSLEDFLRSKPTDEPTKTGNNAGTESNMTDDGDDDLGVEADGYDSDEVVDEDKMVASSGNDVTKKKKPKPKETIVKNGNKRHTSADSLRKKPKSKSQECGATAGRKSVVTRKKQKLTGASKLKQKTKSTRKVHKSDVSDVFNPSDCDETSNSDTSVIGHSSNQELRSQPAAGPSSVCNVCQFDYVVVEFYVQQTNRFKYFIAKVVNFNSDFYTVVFLQQHKSKFFWPDFAEERHVLPTQIRRVLTAPTQKGADVFFNKIEIGSFNFN